MRIGIDKTSMYRAITNDKNQEGSTSLPKRGKSNLPGKSDPQHEAGADQCEEGASQHKEGVIDLASEKRSDFRQAQSDMSQE